MSVLYQKFHICKDVYVNYVKQYKTVEWNRVLKNQRWSEQQYPYSPPETEAANDNNDDFGRKTML